MPGALGPAGSCLRRYLRRFALRGVAARQGRRQILRRWRGATSDGVGHRRDADVSEARVVVANQCRTNSARADWRPAPVGPARNPKLVLRQSGRSDRTDGDALSPGGAVRPAFLAFGDNRKRRRSSRCGKDITKHLSTHLERRAAQEANAQHDLPIMAVKGRERGVTPFQVGPTLSGEERPVSVQIHPTDQVYRARRQV